MLPRAELQRTSVSVSRRRSVFGINSQTPVGNGRAVRRRDFHREGVCDAVFDLKGLDTCIENGDAMEHLCWDVPDYWPLLRPLVRPPGSLLGWQKIWMVFGALVGGRVDDALEQQAERAGRLRFERQRGTLGGQCPSLNGLRTFELAATGPRLH